MQSFISAIPNLYQSVDRKVIYSITRDLRNRGWIPNYDRIEVAREGYQSSTRGGTTSKGTARKWKPNELQVRVDVETEPGPCNIAQQRAQEEYVSPIFQDRALGVKIVPQYDETIWSLSIKIRSTSRERLTLWANTVRLRNQRADDRMEHDLEYSFGLHAESHTLLKQIYELREGKHGDGLTIDEWISSRSLNSMSIVRAGDTSQIEYTENQIEVIGYFTVRPEPKITVVSEGIYEGTLQYTYTVNRPLGLMHYYPIMIHQQLMPYEYIKPLARDYNNVLVFNPVMRGHTYASKAGTCSFKTIAIPAMDKDFDGKYPPGYFPLFTALVCLEDGQPENMFNLNLLEDLELDYGILEVISESYAALSTKPYFSPFLLTLHAGDQLLTEGAIELTTDLDVKLLREVAPQKIYRVSFCLIGSPHRLIHGAWDAIAESHRLKALLAETINRIQTASGSHEVMLMNHYLLPNDLGSEWYFQNVLTGVRSAGMNGNQFGGASGFDQGGWEGAWSGGSGFYNGTAGGSGYYNGASNHPQLYNQHGTGGAGNFGDGWGDNGGYYGTIPAPEQPSAWDDRHEPLDDDTQDPHVPVYGEGFYGRRGSGVMGFHGVDWNGIDPNYRRDHRQLYGRSVYGNNPYYANDPTTHNHPHTIDPDGDDPADSRYRYAGGGLMTTFTVMTSQVHAMYKYQQQQPHPPSPLREDDEPLKPK